MLKKQYIKLYAKYKGLLQNERGAQTLEWVAVAAVVVTIAAVLGSVFSEGSGISDLVEKVFDKIKETL